MTEGAKGGRRHLLSIAELGAEGIEEILEVSDAFVEVGRRSIPKVPSLRGRTVVTLFAEQSTRTRLSFETAAKRLSADVLSFSVDTSSVKKGESLRDTVETVAAMGVDAFVVRHTSAGAPAAVARWVDASVVNAGDGWHEHPTQALLDCYTIRQVLSERAGSPLEHAGVTCFVGLRVAIVGDVRHSRVARSLVLALGALGAEVTLVAPGSLLPPSLEGWPVTSVSYDLDAVLPRVDVCYLLRLQSERGTGAFLPSVHEYRRVVRALGASGRPAGRRRPRDASRADEQGRRDRRRRRRAAAVARAASGVQRRGGADGGALPPGRRAAGAGGEREGSPGAVMTGRGPLGCGRRERGVVWSARPEAAP